ncbi:MAG TPA: HPF/RaiA family ribosome-associated protein [Bryobacteraceae bacterium]|jgi:putative sigma-54 modulation protein|nr:HPF/RaiA family ribosome-associated protein [Bryobacteraceae bacterium]
MKVTYKGMPHPLSPKIQQKLDGKFAKLSKLLDGRGEREAHVVVVQERRLHRVEVTVQFYDHQLVGIGSDSDLVTALSMALEKLDTQAVKTRGKWRETHRRKGTGAKPPESKIEAPVGSPAPVDGGESSPKRVFRVNGQGRRKPMTLDEAMLEMDQNRDYLVYRDAEREGLSVLVRRRDGHFDLIES